MNNDDWFKTYAQGNLKQPIRSGLYNIKWPDDTITVEKITVREETETGGGGHGDPAYSHNKRAYIQKNINGLEIELDLSEHALLIGLTC